MKDKDDNVIYVGKAKSLKKRVSSYFNNNIDPNSKVKKLVNKINDIDYIVTDNELEALILECNLIKKYKPLYNILLKDDKGYKFIKISAPPYSKISVVSKKQKDKSVYIGPYMSYFLAQQIVQTINKIFKLPTCNRNLLEKQNYKRPCLNYYINLCLAPCCNKVSIDEYQSNVNIAIKYLKSGMKPVLKELKAQMEYNSEILKFEEAAKIRDKIKAIKQVNYTENVMISDYENIDVLAVISYDNYICGTLLIFRDYKLIDKKQYLISNNDENLADIRKVILLQYYNQDNCKKPPIIYIDDYPEDFKLLKEYIFKDVEIILSKCSKIKNIIDMAKNNSKERIIQEIKLIDNDIVAINKLKDLLNLNDIPRFIEAYDISNFGSQVIVGAMVVFVDGKPKKSKYKRFKIKNASLQDDYKCMVEIVERRLKQFITNDKSNEDFLKLPNLMLIDGGFAHISTIDKILKKYDLNIPIYGMVKDKNHITNCIISLENKKIEIKNDKDVFLFLKKLQDEVHRFTISYSRKSHNQISLKSVLSNIDGVGKIRQKILLTHFKKLDDIKNASMDKLLNIDGISKSVAKSIYNYFHLDNHI